MRSVIWEDILHTLGLQIHPDTFVFQLTTLEGFKKNSVIKDFFFNYSAYLISSLLSSTLQFKSRKM